MGSRAGAGAGLFSNLHSVSAFPRCDDHLLTKTTTGATVSLLGIALMVILFVAEFASFVQDSGYECLRDGTRCQGDTP